MQQLSLLPSQSTNPLDTSGFKVSKSRTDNAGFKNTFDEVERSVDTRKTRDDKGSEDISKDRSVSAVERNDSSRASDVRESNQHQASSDKRRGTDIDGGRADTAVSKSGKDVPENDHSMLSESGNGLPESVDEESVSSSNDTQGNDSFKSDYVLPNNNVSAAPNGLGILSRFANGPAGDENPLQQAIAAASGAKGNGVGLSVLQGAYEEGVTVPGEKISSLASTSSQARGDAAAVSAVPPGVGSFGFAINGVLQADTSLSENANAKLAELAAKSASGVDSADSVVQAARSSGEALGSGSNGVSGQSVLAGFVGTRGAAGAGVEGLPPQAQAANTEALDQVSETALAAANGNARFNRPGAGGAPLEGQADIASVNGMQAESESLFKTAMESVQVGKGSASTDAADLAALKVDTSSLATKVADAKVAEAQTQNGLKPYVSSLGLPIDDVEWSNQLGQKLMWMNARNIQTAELHLNPADLGPIDVRIQVGAEQSSISFNTQNQSVRELLEANIHRLREMLNNTAHSENSQSGGAFAQNSGSESQGQHGGDSLSQSKLGGSTSVVADGGLDSASRPKNAENALVDAYV